jgi:hypothetical protein
MSCFLAKHQQIYATAGFTASEFLKPDISGNVA